MSGITKPELLRWVDEQRDLDMGLKFLLGRLAAYADADGEAWAKVDTLADHINRDKRTVQNYLKALKEKGLIKDTGRTHRLSNSTRSVPLYRLAPDFGAVDKPVENLASMGENFSPIETAWVKTGDGMGEADFTRIEPIEPKASADALAAREGEGLRQGYEALEAATPRRILGVSDPDEAFAAYCALAAEGLDVAQLPACAVAMAADPAFKSRKFPPALETWLAKRQFRGWWPVPEPPPVRADPAASSPRAHDALPVELVEAIEARKGEAWVTAWLGQAAWIEETRTIVCRLGFQADRVRNDLGQGFLTANAVRIATAAQIKVHANGEAVS